MHAVQAPTHARTFLGDGPRFREEFRRRFDLESFVFNHQLASDPRFEISELGALARRLPTKYYDAGDVKAATSWNKAPKRCSFEDAIERLETSDAWIILKRVHEDPAYASIFENCLAEVQELSGRPLDREIHSKTMSIIMTSPKRITPYHIDGDCNFLFQIRGEKTLFVFDGTDRAVLTDDELERFWMGDTFAPKFREENQSKGFPYLLKPNLGVHVPVNFPHWAQNHNNVSISLSVNFQFSDTLYDAWRGNRILRMLGAQPAAVQGNGKGEKLRAALGGAARVTRKMAKKLRG